MDDNLAKHRYHPVRRHQCCRREMRTLRNGMETGLASIPERLLLAHARQEVLFVVGAGVSCQAYHFPSFRDLVLRVGEADAGGAAHE